MGAHAGRSALVKRNMSEMASRGMAAPASPPLNASRDASRSGSAAALRDCFSLVRRPLSDSQSTNAFHLRQVQEVRTRIHDPATCDVPALRQAAHGAPGMQQARPWCEGTELQGRAPVAPSLQTRSPTTALQNKRPDQTQRACTRQTHTCSRATRTPSHSHHRVRSTTSEMHGNPLLLETPLQHSSWASRRQQHGGCASCPRRACQGPFMSSQNMQ